MTLFSLEGAPPSAPLLPFNGGCDGAQTPQEFLIYALNLFLSFASRGQRLQRGSA
jgi:hypothetical protein